MKKRILVTGGAGFIGSFLCESLIKKGHYVICCDNFYTGNKDNLKDIFNHKNFELLRHDVTFPLYVEVDQIFNFACPASPIHYQNDPVQTVKTCVHGAINMLGLAKRLCVLMTKLMAITAIAMRESQNAKAAPSSLKSNITIRIGSKIDGVPPPI